MNFFRKFKKKIIEFIKNKFQNKTSGGWLLLQQLCIAPLSLFSTVLLAKVLSISDYGYYKYFLSVGGIISLFTLGGVYSITQLNLQRGEGKYFSLGFKYRNLFKWFGFLVAISVAGYYFYKGNYFFGIIFIMFTIDQLLGVFDFYLTILNGKGDFKLLSILSIVNYFFVYFVPIFVAYLGKIFFPGINILYFVVGSFLFMFFVCRFIAYKISLKKYPEFKNQNSNFQKEEIKNFRKEIILSSTAGNIGSLNGSGTNAIIFNRLGPDAVAIYSLAITFADFVWTFSSAIFGRITFDLAKMTEYKKSEDKKIHFLISFFKKYLWFSILFMFICMALLPLVYKIFFFKYLFSVKYAIIYSISILGIIFSVAGAYYLEKRAFKFLNIYVIVSTLINLILVFLGAMYFGLWGVFIVAIVFRIFYQVGLYLRMVINK